ncbi:MAG: hypothetical protein Q9177_001827 [Variospora cf. flavescens]
MDLDISKPWGEIHPTGNSIQEQFLQVQAQAEPREKAVRWANNLKFITPIYWSSANGIVPRKPENFGESVDKPCACIDIPLFRHGDSQTLLLREVPGCVNYVAISYCWKAPENARILRDIPIYSLRSGTRERANRARWQILHRAFRYAASYYCGLIWIDQECIDQDDREDKETGIQSMDLVYKRAAFPVGLLNFRIRTQQEMDTMALIVSIAKGYRISPTEVQIDGIIHIFEALTADAWFSRSWILQEVVCAGDMKLCIEFDVSLTKPECLGYAKNEVEITPEQLKEAALLVNLPPLDEPYQPLANRIGSAKAARLQQASKVPMGIRPGTQLGIDEQGLPLWQWACNAAEALKLLERKQNERVSDRLAIVANLCHYSTRINTNGVEALGIGFSTCVWVMALLNGDVSLLNPARPVHGWNPTEPVNHQSWLPEPSMALSSIPELTESGKRLRLQGISLSANGMKCQGYLYRVTQRIELSDLASSFKTQWINATATSPLDYKCAQQILGEFLLSLLLKLDSLGLTDLADALWHSVREDYVSYYPSNNEGPSVSIREERLATWYPPSCFQAMLDETDGAKTLHLPDWARSTEDFARVFGDSSSVDDFRWLIDFVTNTGCLWGGGLFDQAIGLVDVIFGVNSPGLFLGQW